MNTAIAKKTQETLGKVIKKPPLTDKLLSKPPFRFLHDIITEVVKNTGFLKGLYTADEMDSAKVKEKEAKILFLQKAIDVVGMINGQLSVRPSKIVAGHEPEKTNEFLQAMGMAILSKKSSTDAVKKVLAGEKPGKEPSSDSKRKESKTGNGSKDRESSKERDKEKNKERDRSRDREKEDDKDKRKQSDSSRRKESSSNKAESSDKRKRDDSAKKEKEKERDKEKQTDRGREKEKEPRKEDNVQDSVDGETAVIDGELENGEVPLNRIPRPSSAKGQRRRPSGEGEDLQEGESDGPHAEEQPRPTEQMNGVLNDEELPPQVIKSRSIARPSSARPAPPKIKKQQEELEDQMARIGSGKQVASVIVDDGKDQDDEDDTFVVEDPNAIQNDVDLAPAGEVAEDDGEHGGLVRKILETKKELEGGEKEARPKQERQAPIISDAARRKERELAQKEIEKLRTSIQTLTRSANPLGKIMDYIQEDMDSMQKELDIWRRENKEHEIALRREESITESEIAPLKSQLEELDTEITEMVDRISTVKCNILRNDEKIQKMLSSVSLTSR